MKSRQVEVRCTHGVLLRCLVVAVTEHGSLCSDSNLCVLWAAKLWSSGPAGLCLQGTFWLLCQGWPLILPWQCHGWLLLDSPRRGCGLSGCDCCQLLSIHPSSAEAHCYHIMGLFNRAPKIFNLAVSCCLSWVQTALFYTSTCIYIVILPTSG